MISKPVHNIEQVIIYNEGTKYLEKGNFKKAVVQLKKALAICPIKEGYVNLANCYRALGYDKNLILETYKKALDPKVDYLQQPESIKSDTCQHALNNIGLHYYTYGDDDTAIKYYNKAIDNNPEFYEAIWNLSTALLRKASAGEVGLFKDGWYAYTARFLKSPPVQLKNKCANLKYWVPFTKVDSIIVLTEQGIGDNIMFGRYISLLKEYADKIYVQCDPSLEVIFSDYTCVRDASEVSVSCAYPICSLGILSDVPPAGDWLKGKFNAREFPSESFNVGIVWSGSPTHTNNAYRSVPVGRFSRLSKHCTLWGLQPGFSGNKHVRALPCGSWAETASAIAGLDLVIGVDTSVMHMVGSMGCRGWLLQPYKETDFRWGYDGGVWYPSIEVFPNNQDWDDVFDRVEAALCLK